MFDQCVLLTLCTLVVAIQVHIEAYILRQAALYPPKTPSNGLPDALHFNLAIPKSGRVLRDYQIVGAKFMVKQFIVRKPCIIGDEVSTSSACKLTACD